MFFTQLSRRLGWTGTHSPREGAILWTALAFLRGRSPKMRYLCSTTGIALLIAAALILTALPGIGSLPLSVPETPTTAPASLPTAAAHADAPAHPKLLLVTRGNYVLEKIVKKIGMSADATIMTPEKYESNGTSGRDVVIFDCYQPKKAPLPRGILYFGVVPPGSKLAEVDAQGTTVIAKDLVADPSPGDSPSGSEKDGTRFYVAKAIKLRQQPNWTTVVLSQRGSLIVAHGAAGLREIVVPFDLRNSNWPLKPGFPNFVYASIIWLAGAESQPLSDRPTTAPTTQPQAGFVPLLQLRLVARPGDDSDADEMVDPDNHQTVRVLKKVEIDERDVLRAYTEKSESGLTVRIDLSEEGAKKFGKLTGANIHHQLAIVFKGSLLTAPMIQSRISAAVMISPGANGFSDAEAHALADSINSLTPSPASAPTTQPGAAAGAESPQLGSTSPGSAPVVITTRSGNTYLKLLDAHGHVCFQLFNLRQRTDDQELKDLADSIHVTINSPVDSESLSPGWIEQTFNALNFYLVPLN
jgi:hypothetical protein